MQPNQHRALPDPDTPPSDFPAERPGALYSYRPKNPGSSPHYSRELSGGQEIGESSDSERGLLDYWRMIMRHKTVIVVASVVTALIGFAVSIPMLPVYRARTSLEILNLNEDFMNLKQTSPTASSDTSQDLSEAETQIRLIQSDSLLARVIQKLNSGKPVSKRKMAKSGWRAWLHLREPAKLTNRERLIENAATTLKVHANAHTRIIEATVDSTDPELASSFANTLVEQYIQQNLEARFAATHQTSDWLSREIDGARDSLKSSENALQAYASSSGLIFTDENSNVATEKLQQLQKELSAATAERIGKQARYELARYSPPDTVAEVLNDTGLKETSAKLNDLRRHVAELSAVYTPEFSQLKRAHAELEVIEAAFEKTRADILKRIENDYHEAVNREKLLETAYDAQTRAVTGQDEKAIQYNILKREVDGSRQLYDTMLQQTKQSSIASALRASNVRVVDRAESPQVPFSPDFKLNSAIGLMAGLFFSVSLVIVREQADRTLRHPGEMKLWTDLPELGIVPRAEDFVSQSHGAGAFSVESSTREASSLVSPSSRNGGDLVELTTWLQKPSLLAEAFRSILASILFVGEMADRPRVLAITSPQALDGKTTVVTNLAIAMAEIRFRVLVIDADLRRPRVHEIFRVSNERGLSDLLCEPPSSDEPIGLIQRTEIPNLFVLPAGPASHAASHLLYSPKYPELLERFKEEFDMVLIDTPPMLPMTDARIAGRSADAVILVARAGKTTRDAILAAKERLSEDSTRVLGMVLNSWNSRQSWGHPTLSYYKNQQQYASSASRSARTS
jgi:capsular exopolysaccharide synthesis family protein